MLILVQELIITILNLQLVIVLEYQNIETFLQKTIFQIGLNKFFLIKKLKTLFCGHIILVILTGEEIVGTFYEKELQKTNQKEFRIEKAITKTIDQLCVKWKGYNNFFNTWIDKKDTV